MCALDTDPYTPSDYKNAEPQRRAEIEAWLHDDGMAAASCEDCDAVTFVCGDGCQRLFYAEHADCADDSDDADYAAYVAEREADRLAVASYADELTREQAQSIVTRAVEVDQHVRGCNLSVEHCDTCCWQEQDHAAHFWEFDVPAARQRLARDRGGDGLSDPVERAEKAIQHIDEARAEAERDAAARDYAARSAAWSAEDAATTVDRAGGLDLERSS